MQDGYVGDIGDFAKYGLLRAISEGRNLGVAWYLHPDSGPLGDGRHTQYLERPEEWRHPDCELFDDLKQVVDLEQRSVTEVQKRRILGDAVFADEQLDIEKVPVCCRESWRRTWFDRVKETLADLAALPSNRLEARRGDRAGQHSIRINAQWRVCFRWADEGPCEVEIVDYH